ncbi:MAG: quinolinate synthase NadA [Spirochaetales bacterium]|nr:quinolinate synthase NadA [Spirochaetales bacterium]
METITEIVRLKKEYGDKLCILAHYYQRDEVYQLADFSGDSYQLALEASRSGAGHIVFCGVTFMAESARILARPEQRVYLPDREAGCPLADMADDRELAPALEEIQRTCLRPIVPVVYINSTASLKAAVAKAGGIVCTSSNAALLVRSLLAEGNAVLFLPDRNLGLSVAGRIPLSKDEIAFFGRETDGPEVTSAARMIIWDGFCNVHVRFTAMDVMKAKNQYPSARVFVHPECREEVTSLADYVGSTSGIIRECEKAAAGEVLFIGTELNLVERLAAARKDAKIFPLRRSGCLNMNKITPEKVLAALRSMNGPSSPYEVFVPEEESALAVRALRGMIERVERAKE